MFVCKLVNGEDYKKEKISILEVCYFRALANVINKTIVIYGGTSGQNETILSPTSLGKLTITTELMITKFFLSFAF